VLNLHIFGVVAVAAKELKPLKTRRQYGLFHNLEAGNSND